MKKFGWIAAAVVLLFVFIGIGWYIGGLNRVVRMDEMVNEAWAQIDTQLQRRNDLIPNLVETVRGFARHEREVLDNLARARTQYAGAVTVKEKMEASRNMDSALARLLVIVENYPNLKANQNFLALQDQLEGTENRIAVARMRYNRAVRAFNSYIREVLGRFFARRRNLDEPRPYFETAPEARAVPQVEFR